MNKSQIYLHVWHIFKGTNFIARFNDHSHLINHTVFLYALTVCMYTVILNYQ